MPSDRTLQVIGRPVNDHSWRTHRDTRDLEVRPGKERTARVDLGLALLSIARKPGHEITRYDIAAWTGVTDAAILRIEESAFRKLRKRASRIAQEHTP